MKNISVIGAGYVGLVTAVCFAELGNKVNIIEIDPNRVADLENDRMPIHEPDLPELWKRNRSQGRLSVTDSYIKGLLGANFAFIAVGTPATRNGKPDLKWVRSAVTNIAQAASGPLTVVMKSTVPLGTADMVS